MRGQPARPHTLLPAERELAAALGLSRSTVAAAYQSLRDSAHIRSLRGSGSVTLPLARRDVALVDGGVEAVDLQQASPPAWPGLAGVFAEVAGSAATLVGRSGYDMRGSLLLRACIAARYTARGVATTPEQILVTNGAQSAIHLLGRVLIGRGDRVVVETPTYPHAAEALREAGGRLVGVPVSTAEGWDLERVAQVFARTVPALAYLMPDFQNPTGRSMTPGEAEIVARSAERAGTTLVLDETTAELDIDRQVPGRSFDAWDDPSIVRLGSLGKTVWGGLRIGWVRAGEELIRRLIAARPVHDLGTPEFEQAVALALLERMDEIVPQRAALLGGARDALRGALNRRLPQWRVPRPEGGVSLWVELDAPLSAALVMDVRTRGVLLSAGPRFSVDGGHDRHLRLPFTAPIEDYDAVVGNLAASWERVRQGAPATVLAGEDALV
ncbi:PLP-dependent aminotransferase family protein [Microbacterium hominis]|uniref:MocR-like transcription factor YczR n=1 Tax=Microbacterium hominis TaxID=162426 RepID=UPI0020B89EC3|nr:PLP-dependent aminotransferase family protein [Microbacterium hominis]